MLKNKPKIVMLTSNISTGGLLTSTRLLVRYLDREKFHIIVVACGPGPQADRIGKLADEYYNLNVGTFPRVRKMKKGKYREDFRGWIALLIWILRCTWRFTCWLRKNKVDLIHTNNIHFNIIAGFAGRFAGVSSIWHIRWSQNTARQRGFGFPLVALIEGYLPAFLATRFIANSNYTVSTFRHSWRKKTVVIWNAIDAKAIAANQHPGRLRELANVSDGEKLVGITGMISHRKGMDRFIEMASELARERDDVKFVIVGGAPQEMEQVVKADLVKLAEKLGISERLCFTGNIDDAPYYMGDMDAFFMCSRPGTETFGLVVIEAMAAGVPVVAFCNDAMPEIIEDGKTAFLVPEGDITAAKERILQILNDSKLASSLTKAAKKRVFKDFDFPVLISSVEKLYMEVLQ